MIYTHSTTNYTNIDTQKSVHFAVSRTETRLKMHLQLSFYIEENCLNNSGTKCICYTYQIPSKCINSAKIEPLKFRPLLLKVSFSRPFQLMKINCTESYVFFLARTYRARIQLSFTNTRCIQYSPHVNPCVSPYRVPNLTLGTKYKYTNEH